MANFDISARGRERAKLKKRGEKFHEWRILKGFSREFLAKEAGVSSKTIYNLEQGKRVSNSLIYHLEVMSCPQSVLFPE